MSITREQVTQIARLARLKTDSAEAEFYAGQLSGILELVEQMNRIDTHDIEPMSHPHQTALRFREDRVTAQNRREAYQRIAPATRHGLYLAPKVIEREIIE